MINFYNTLKTGFQFILILLSLIISSNISNAQGGGTAYTNNNIIDLEIDETYAQAHLTGQFNYKTFL